MESFLSIVVAVDFTPQSRAATERAAMLAKRGGAAVHLVHSARLPTVAMSHEFAIPAPDWETIRRASKKRIEAIAADLEGRGLDATSEVRREEPVDAILAAVAKHDSDLIVMGSHGHTGLRHMVLGSVAERTLRAAPIPVMVVKEDEAGAGKEIERILLATDFSPHADSAAKLAIAFAKGFGASVEICHVQAAPTVPWVSTDLPPPNEWVEALRRKAAERIQDVLRAFTEAGVDARTHLVGDTPSVAIPALADERGADLIIMGTRGHSGLRHVALGSVAERTVRIATCSVLTAPRPPGPG